MKRLFKVVDDTECQDNIKMFGLDAAKEFFVGKFKPEERAAVREVLERVTDVS